MAFDPTLGNWTQNPLGPYIGLNPKKDLKLVKKSSGIPLSNSNGTPYIPGLPVYNESYSAANPANPWVALNAAAVAAAKKNSAAASSSSVTPNTDPFIDFYAGLDPEKMVRREFDPQYSLISQMEGQAKKRYTAAGNEIGQGWDLLAKSIAGREKGLKAAGTARTKAATSGFENVGKKSDAAIDQARAQLIADAQRTNTMEQIAPLLAQLASQKATLRSESGSRGANWGAFETQMGANEVEANRLAADNAKWGGIGARADFSTRLQSALDELGNKRLEIKGNEGGAFNKYSMDLAGARTSAKAAWDALQTQRADQAIKIAASEAKAAADAAKAAQPKAIDPSKLTPAEYLAYTAKGLYSRPGEGGGRAQNAANAIMDVARSGKRWTNVTQFVNDVLKNNPNASHAGGDARQLAQLANDYYLRVTGGANKPWNSNIT